MTYTTVNSRIKMECRILKYICEEIKAFPLIEDIPMYEKSRLLRVYLFVF